MKSMEEQMQQILQRKTYYLARRRSRLLAALTSCLGVLLLAVMLVLPQFTGTGEGLPGSLLGATLLGPEAGGYVIVALLAFALGITATLYTQKYREMNKTAPKREKENRDEKP